MTKTEDHIDGILTFEAVTGQVRVAVQSYYLNEQSKPETHEYFWAYRIKITNESDSVVRLLNRHWIITNGRGETKEVRGDGVIGEQPTLLPSQSFVYTSGTPLDTPTGFMTGSYGMMKDEATMIEVAIPTFSLDSPHSELKIN